MDLIEFSLGFKIFAVFIVIFVLVFIWLGIKSIRSKD